MRCGISASCSWEECYLAQTLWLVALAAGRVNYGLVEVEQAAVAAAVVATAAAVLPTKAGQKSLDCSSIPVGPRRVELLDFLLTDNC